MFKRFFSILLLWSFTVTAIPTSDDVSHKQTSLLQNITDTHLRKKQTTMQESTVMLDTRTPPRYKYQLEVAAVQNLTDTASYVDGEVIPVTDHELLYQESKNSSSVPKDGSSAWVLLSNNTVNGHKEKTTPTSSTTVKPVTKMAEKKSRKPEQQTPESKSTSTTTKKPKKQSNRRKSSSSKKKSGPKTKTSSTNTTTSSVTSPLKNKVSTNSQKPMSTRIMNFFSREIVPSVGFGVMTVAVLTGIFAYFSHGAGIYRSYTTEPIRRNDYSNVFYNGGGVNEELAASKVLSQDPYYYNTIYGQPDQEEDRKLNPKIKAKGYVYSNNLHQPRSLNLRKKRDTTTDLQEVEKEQWGAISESFKNIRKSIKTLFSIYFKRPIDLGLNMTRKFKEMITKAETRFFSVSDVTKRRFGRDSVVDNEIDGYNVVSEIWSDSKTAVISTSGGGDIGISGSNLKPDRKPQSVSEIFSDYMRKKFYIALLMTKSVTETLDAFLEEMRVKIEQDLKIV